MKLYNLLSIIQTTFNAKEISTLRYQTLNIKESMLPTLDIKESILPTLDIKGDFEFGHFTHGEACDWMHEGLHYKGLIPSIH